MIWLSALVPIAEIAERLLRIFIKGDLADGPPYTGPVMWSIDSQKQAIAVNKGSEDVGLFFSKTEADSTTTALVKLKPGDKYKASKDFEDFTHGTVTIAPLPETTSDEVKFRLLTLAVRWLAPAIAVSIVRGVTVKYEKKDTGFVATIETTGPKVKSVDLRVGDPGGNIVSVKSDFELAAGATREIKIPAGVDLEPVAKEFDIAIEVEQAAFEETIAERQALVTPGEG